MGVYADYFLKDRSIKNRLIQSINKRLTKLKFFFYLKETKKNNDDNWETKANFLDQIERNNTNVGYSTTEKSPQRIVHFIGSLSPGGAERQFCNCITKQKEMGFNVSALFLYTPKKDHGHYLNLLKSAKVPFKIAGEIFNPSFKKNISDKQALYKLARRVPAEFNPMCLDVLGELLADPPTVFHSWLDHSNIWGGIAAIYARVPQIILSTRNVNPTHFHYMNLPYFQPMYKKILMFPSVQLINNSNAGALDYAKWLGQPKKKFKVIRNGVNFNSFKKPHSSALLKWRKKLKISKKKRIIAGVFRLQREKQPMVFLEVAKRLISKYHDICFVIAGVGPYEKEMKAFVNHHNLNSKILFVGRCKNVGRIYSSAYLKLLCSAFEGTPNVLLEAQWYGCPVVATSVGGVAQVVKNKTTGYLVHSLKITNIVKTVMRLLDNVAERKKLSANGPSFVAEHFNVERMVRETLSLYHPNSSSRNIRSSEANF